MAAENFKVKKGLEVGTGITANSDGVNVTGIITATQFKGDGSGLTGVVGSGSGVVVKDEGSAVGTAGTINFVGSGVAAAITGGTATVTINSGGLSDVVGDTTPQLGGNLDLNSKFITGSGNIDITGSLDVSGIATVGTLKGAIDATTASFSGAIDANGDLDVDGQTEVDDLNIAGVSTFNDNVTVVTSKMINVGTSNTVRFFNNGSVFRIQGQGSSVLAFDTPTSLTVNSGATNAALFNPSGATKLYFAGNQKLTTTINGIEVPDLNVTGVGTVGRLETSGVTLGTNSTTFAAKFADDAVANFGTDNDLKIFHDDNDATIVNSKGSLRLQNNTFIVLEETDGTNLLRCDGGGAVNLYFNGGSPKLVTDQAGVKITGVCTATSFSGSAAGLTNIPSAQLSGALPALDGSALTGITASGSGIIVKHDGSTVGTAGTINFSTNLDVSAISAGIVTVTASGGGVSLSGSTNNTVATVTGANALIGEANLTFDGSTLAVGGSTNEKLIFSGSSNPYITFKEGTTTKAYVQWNSSGYLDLVNQESSEVLRIESGSDGLKYVVNGTEYKVWHELNDGASSGLDADLLDGQEGSYYTNATNLGSGTIPNARFPATLPAISGANLTSLNADNISSGTLATARIEDDAINADKLNNTGVSAGSYTNASITVDAQGRLTSASTGSSGITTAPSNVVLTWDVVNQGASAYRFTGPGQDPTANNPDIYLVRGNKYRFALSASGHPFQIRVSNGGSAYNDGVTNNGAQSGNVEFYVQNDAPASLVYQCTSHGGMVGNIYITGHQLTNGANNRVLTATSAYGMTGESGLTFDGSTLNLTSASGDARVTLIGTEGNDARLSLVSDDGDDHIDQYNLRVDASDNSFFIDQFESGSFVQRFRIANGGKIVMGNSTTSTTQLDIRFTDTTAYSATSNHVNGLKIFNDSNTDNGFAGIELAATDGDDYYGSTLLKSIADGTNYTNDFAIQTRIGGNYAERLRITSAGKFGFGTSSPDSSFRTTIQEGASGHGVLILDRTSNIDGNFRSFVSLQRNGTAVGTILCNNSSTQYNTTSDHRLKENVVTMSNATDRLKQLQPKRFNFILNPDITVDGFLAHEVQSVVPEAISGTKDEVDSDNNPVYQGIDQSKLVPLLTAALQESITEIETLKAKVAALEGS